MNDGQISIPHSGSHFWPWLKTRNNEHGWWNGYLGQHLPPRIKGECDPHRGCPQLTVAPPEGGWPQLTPQEHASIEALAERNGGHPKFSNSYMDFSDQIFSEETDLSELMFVDADFSRVTFGGGVKLSEKTLFYAQTWFNDAVFSDTFFCGKTRFDAPVSFSNARFNTSATFLGAQFMGGASFAGVTFKGPVMFNDSKFEERYFSGGITIPHLADFRNTRFMSRAAFREVLFGNDATTYSRRLWPERRADFTDAVFSSTTTFRGSVFGGAPAFFNATLHEDTDLGRIDWDRADTDNIPVDYAIRAWERLELIMSKLEKPFDRHQFFRLKMRARRRSDGVFLKVANWLFEKTADYGWGVGRAFVCWFLHWAISAVILFANTLPKWSCASVWNIAMASIGTGFANAHSFLFLTAKGGYLEESLELMKENDGLELLTKVGTTEAILGPILLFLLLLTLRNRFRLA